MIIPIIEDEIIQAQNVLRKAEYERCTFKHCTLTNSDLSKICFTDCTFEDCDLSMALLHEVAFRNVVFSASKLVGARFEDCNAYLLSFKFEDCILDFTSFYQLKIKNTNFKNCRLLEADFSHADLTSSTFNNCNLEGAIFDNTNLTACNLQSALHFRINPSKNIITKAIFSQQNLAGLLQDFQITILP